jgi:runt-related transcription factor 1
MEEHTSGERINILSHLQNEKVKLKFTLQMLNCIMGMVDKTKRALSILQQRQVKSGLGQPSTNCLEQQSSSACARRHAFTPAASSSVNELLAATIRSTEERVIEVRRRAEEAVHEVRIGFKRCT